MTIIPIKIISGRFPLNYQSLNGKQFFRDFISRIKGWVDGSKVIIGVKGTVKPTYNAGPWLDTGGGDTRWQYWDSISADYASRVVVGETGPYTVEFKAGPNTANRIARFRATTAAGNAHEEVDGTIAFIPDTLVPAPAALLDMPADSVSGAITIDSTAISGPTQEGFVYTRPSKTFVGKLGKSFTLFALIMNNGEKITVKIQNVGTAFDFDWAGLVKWPGGSVPSVLHSTSVGVTGTLVVVIRKINNIVCGESITSTLGSPPDPIVDIGADPPINYGNNQIGLPGSRESKLP